MTDMTVEHAMQLADLLYSAGYDARHKERDYDPRGCGAWQDVVEALTAPSVPEGWKLVPREPTVGMWDSAETAMIESEWAYDAGEPDVRSDAHGFPTMRIWQAVVAYRAMLAAVPEEEREDAERWRQAFVNERASRYRADGMKIEQARIHAETDAVVAAIDRARGKEVQDEA